MAKFKVIHRVELSNAPIDKTSEFGLLKVSQPDEIVSVEDEEAKSLLLTGHIEPVDSAGEKLLKKAKEEKKQREVEEKERLEKEALERGGR